MSEFDGEAWQLLIKTSINGVLIVCFYVFTYCFLDKYIKSKKIKSIFIGIITPIFFYYSTSYLLHPFTVLLYFLKIDTIGLTSGVLFYFLKPLSLISGILVALYLNNKK